MTTAATTPDILARLKAETRADHDAIEAALDLTGSALTRVGYRRRLERFLGFYARPRPASGRSGGGPTAASTRPCGRRPRCSKPTSARSG